MKRDRTIGNYGSRALTLLSRDVGGTNLSLNIDGNISISGQLIFENKDLINLNSNDNKSWDLDINQTQRFNVEGNVGDKLKVKIRQDSEADFDFRFAVARPKPHQIDEKLISRSEIFVEKNFSASKKSNVENRPKRVFAKFRADPSQF